MSPLQAKIYNFIQIYSKEYGDPPSLFEIAQGIGADHYSQRLIVSFLLLLKKANRLALNYEIKQKIRLVFSVPCQLPIIANISAGSPVDAIEQEKILDLAALLSKENCYILQVEGNSMSGEGILNGDMIICRPQNFAHEGDIVVALIDQEKATLKRIHYQSDDVIVLEPANPAFKPQTYAANRVIIQGIFIGLLRLPENKLTI